MKGNPVCVTGILILILVQASLASGQQVVGGNPTPPSLIELRAPKSVVRMELFGGRPVVSVRVNGKGPFLFALETGVTGTMVSTELARELGLPDMGEAIAGRPGTAVPARATMTRIDKLELGGAEISGLVVVSGDVSSVWTGNHLPRGVLNAASFPSLLVTLDYSAKRIELQRGQLPAVDGRTIFAWDAEGTLPSTPLALNDLKLEVALNLGLASGIDLPEKYADQLRLTSEPEAVPRNRTNTGDGESEITVATLNGMAKVGEFTIHHPQIRFIDEMAYGNIGREILERFVITLDSKNRRLRLAQKAGKE
jgi:Aspartyl protease